ncbi:MAG: type III pantothenate kinase [Bacilli bacterium]
MKLLKKRAQAISWCSVVPRYSKEFQDRVSGIKEVFNLNFKTSPMRIDMHYPEQVGQDRIADALGAGVFLSLLI